MIIDQPCFKAEKTETAYWTADYRPEIKEKLKKADKVCRNKKCGECEGYCEKDSGRCQINHSLHSLVSWFDTQPTYSSDHFNLSFIRMQGRFVLLRTWRQRLEDESGERIRSQSLGTGPRMHRVWQARQKLLFQREVQEPLQRQGDWGNTG